MFEIVFLTFISFYFFITVYLLNGIKKSFPQISDSELPALTVIVAARNEEKNIPECLNSLNRLNYPPGKLEIILVDDFSTDNTGKIIDAFISGKTIFKKIFPDETLKIPIGKTRAVASAVKAAGGEIILLTDADCSVPADWARSIAGYYLKDIGMVNGFTTQAADNLFQGMQAVDLVYLISAAAGMANNNNSVSCIGNNMSFRKSAYYEAGGYENIQFSVTEDFILLKSISRLKKYKIIFPLNPASLVITKPCRSIKELFRQKKRWAVGGMNINLNGFLIMFTAAAVNISVLLTPLFFSAVSLYLAVFKLAIDFFLLMLVHQSLGIKKNLKYFFFFEIYYIIYTIILPISVAISRKVIWKGRSY